MGYHKDWCVTNLVLRGASCNCEAAERYATNMPPLTNKEKQEAFRARNALLGLTEVRGIYSHPDDHQAIKEYARKLTQKRQKEQA